MITSLKTAIAITLLCSSAAIAAPADQPGHESPAPGSKSNAMSAVEDLHRGRSRNGFRRNDPYDQGLCHGSCDL